MRILHVVPTYWPAVRYGGPIVSVHGLAKAQRALCHEVEVFTTNVDGPGVSAVPIERQVDLDGVDVTYFPTGWGRRLYRSPRMMAALEARVGEFDIVHVHSVFLWPTVAACMEAKRRARPFVLSPRGMLVPELVRKKSRAIKSGWLALYAASTIGEAHSVHVTSEVEADGMRRLGLRPRRIDVVPNGIDVDDPSAFHDVRCSSEPTLVSIGRLHWTKGLDRTIDAMRLLPEARLELAGNDEDGYRALLKDRCRSAQVEDRVKFLGPVYGEAKWKMLASADLFVAPSLSENFGNAILEAMACGTPVVVTPEVGLSDAIQRAGAGLVVKGEPQALAEAISDLLRDKERRLAMSKAARRLVIEEFSWNSVAVRMEQVYADATTTGT